MVHIFLMVLIIKPVSGRGSSGRSQTRWPHRISGPSQSEHKQLGYGFRLKNQPGQGDQYVQNKSCTAHIDLSSQKWLFQTLNRVKCSFH